MSDIRLENISKKFGEHEVLKNLSMTFPEGKTTVVMGRSGGGKTTLIRILAGLLKPEAGDVKNIPEKISFVFQEDRLCPAFNAVSNVRFVTGKSVPESEIAEALQAVGIRDFKKPVSEMSGGTMRRVAIARALCVPADLYLLDEPFKGLDDERKESVMQWVKEKTLGKTVIMITHDTSEANFMGDQVVNLDVI